MVVGFERRWHCVQGWERGLPWCKSMTSSSRGLEFKLEQIH